MNEPLSVAIRATGGSHGRAGAKVLSNNLDAYENAVPAMLSDRLRNPKFSGPADPQTGLAPEWEPGNRCMAGYSCQLVPGMYLSGREAQLIHCYAENNRAFITQVGVPVRAGEEFEVEMWARAQHRPVTVKISLTLPGQKPEPESSAEMLFDLAHWQRRTCRIKTPGAGGGATFGIAVRGESRLVVDQVHLRPVGEPHVAPALLESFDHYPCASLRFPGGCQTCTYHWEHGIGPVHRRPVDDDPVFKYKIHYDFGTDEFLDLCAARGIVPFITLNTTTATPEDAAAWAGYVRNYYVSRGLAIPQAYFMFGNENMATHEIGHMTPEMYVAQLRAFVPPVRQAYPEAKMLAIGEFDYTGLHKEETGPWRSVVIEQAADLFDVLALTRYSFGYDRTFDICLQRVAETVREMERDLQRQVQTLREAGLDRTIAIAEWNYWTRAGHNDHAGFYEPNDIRHCLYAAAYTNALCRLGERLESAHYYGLVNTMGTIHLHDGLVRYSDVVKVFDLYHPALPGEVLEIEVAAPALGDAGAVVDANFIRAGSTTYGFLVNYSPSESATVSLEQLGDITAATGLKAAAILQPVDEFVPEFSGSRVKLPPASLVRVIVRS